MPIVKLDDWEECQRKNIDAYGSCIVNVARRVMEILDEDSTPLRRGYHPDVNTPHGIICKADKDTQSGGITGFMAGCVAQIVVYCHSRGEEFRKIWNTENQIGDEGDKANENGVVSSLLPEVRYALECAAMSEGEESESVEMLKMKIAEAEEIISK